jgi:hypothetical protein
MSVADNKALKYFAAQSFMECFQDRALFAAYINLKAQGPMSTAEQDAAILKAFRGHIPLVLEDVASFPMEKRPPGQFRSTKASVSLVDQLSRHLLGNSKGVLLTGSDVQKQAKARKSVILNSVTVAYGQFLTNKKSKAVHDRLLPSGTNCRDLIMYIFKAVYKSMEEVRIETKRKNAIKTAEKKQATLAASSSIIPSPPPPSVSSSATAEAVESPPAINDVFLLGEDLVAGGDFEANDGDEEAENSPAATDSSTPAAADSCTPAAAVKKSKALPDVPRELPDFISISSIVTWVMYGDLASKPEMEISLQSATSSLPISAPLNSDGSRKSQRENAKLMLHNQRNEKTLLNNQARQARRDGGELNVSDDEELQDSAEVKKQKIDAKFVAQSEQLNTTLSSVASIMERDSLRAADDSLRASNQTAILNAKSLYDATGDNEDKQVWLELLRGNRK